MRIAFLFFLLTGSLAFGISNQSRLVLKPLVLSVMPGVRLGPAEPGAFLLTQALKKYRIYPWGLVVVGRADFITLSYLGDYRFPSLGGRGGLGWAFLNTTQYPEAGKGASGVTGHVAGVMGGGVLLARNGFSASAISNLEALGYHGEIYVQGGLQLDFHFYRRGHGVAVGADVDYDFIGKFFLLRFSMGYLF